MNTYYKYAPNVFLAKCEEPHEKGDIIIVTTQYGKENECIVHNLIAEAKGFFYYSIIRADGFNAQEWAKKKAEKYNNYASNAEKQGDRYYNASNKDKDFLSLAEPIKVGHHSERGHRKIIEQAWNNMGKFIECEKRAEEHLNKAEYWEKKANVINLSMPESIEFYRYKLDKAKEYHEGLKSGKYQKQHSYSLPYAKKDVNEAQKNLDLAIKLWA